MRQALYPATSKSCQLDGCTRSLQKSVGGTRSSVAQKCTLCGGLYCSNHCAQRPVWQRGYVRLCDTCYGNMRLPGLRQFIQNGMGLADVGGKGKRSAKNKTWRSSMVDNVSELLGQPDEVLQPDQFYLVAVKAAAEEAAVVGAARTEKTTQAAGALTSIPGQQIYEAMTMVMLDQFLAYFNREEKTQTDRLAKWYDTKMRRLADLIATKERGGESAVVASGSPDPAFEEVMIRPTRKYSASASGRPLSTMIHHSIGRAQGSGSGIGVGAPDLDDDFDDMEDGFDDDGTGAGTGGAPLSSRPGGPDWHDELSAKEQLYKNVDLLLDGRMDRKAFDASVTECIELNMMAMSTLRAPDHQWTTVRDFEDGNFC